MNKLKGIMRENNVTQQELVDKLEISVQTFNSKINGRTAFTIPEAKKIIEFLEIKKPEEIFLAVKSQICNNNKILMRIRGGIDGG